ncbi:hypothetical protein AB0K21_42260 [Streptosporangium sp. NPDC049248]|uniref:hypothetical protein n=1 Tax=Streptosporangium sp. NPDC049248 TaxID=3155651 RepID=UPI00341A81FC
MTTVLINKTALGYDDLVLLVAEHAELLAAARATVAAAALGEGDPLIHLRHALAAHGQLPPEGARPVVLLARCSAPTVLPRCLIGEVS